MNFSFKNVTGIELAPWIEELALLRMTVFREFPYLYEGSLDYEKDYLSVYLNSKNSLVILVFHEEKLVGASTCIPLQEEVEEFQDPFLKKSLDINSVFYFGESIVLKEFRGNKLGHKFFKMREGYAKKILRDALNYTVFCAVDRPDNHPLKPDGFQPLDSFWNKLGYQKQESMRALFPWKDIDQKEETKKNMSFWIKEWNVFSEGKGNGILSKFYNS